MKKQPSKRQNESEGGDERLFNFEIDEIEFQEDLAEKDLNEFTVPLVIGSEKVYPVKEWDFEKDSGDDWDDFIFWNSELN